MASHNQSALVHRLCEGRRGLESLLRVVAATRTGQRGRLHSRHSIIISTSKLHYKHIINSLEAEIHFLIIRQSPGNHTPSDLVMKVSGYNEPVIILSFSKDFFHHFGSK